MGTAVNKIVLAYSGGLDTSAIIPWLKEHYPNCQVVAFVADVGQNREDLVNIEQKALHSGASECHIVDLRETFVSDYVYPVLKTGALYEGYYLLGTAMARPVIAKAQVELALKIGADALAHGATGKGNDQVRFETTYAALAPHLTVIAPWREWQMRSRKDLLNYLATKQISTTASLEKIYSRDENAWHISTEGGLLEDPWQAPTEECWQWTTSPQQAPDKAEQLHLTIEAGKISAINQQKLSPYHCLLELNQVAAKHGIGRIDIVENRLVGMKSRGCYETPGGTVMMQALRALEQLVLDRDSYRWRQQLAAEMAYVVYDGRWFSPVCRALLASAEVFSASMNGEVVVELYKGQVTVQQKSSPQSLYSQAYATFDEDDLYNQKHAEGFIRLYSLPMRISALQQQD